MRTPWLAMLSTVNALKLMYVDDGSNTPGNSSLESWVTEFGVIPNVVAEEVVYFINETTDSNGTYFKYDQAVESGVTLLQAMLRNNTDPVVLLGWDFGTLITAGALVGAPLSKKNLTALEPEYTKNVLAIIQISDPGRVKGQGELDGWVPCTNLSGYDPREGQYKEGLDKFNLMTFCEVGDINCCYNATLPDDSYDFEIQEQYFYGLAADDGIRFVKQQMASAGITATGAPIYNATTASVPRTQVRTAPATAVLATTTPTSSTGAVGKLQIEMGAVGLAAAVLML